MELDLFLLSNNANLEMDLDSDVTIDSELRTNLLYFDAPDEISAVLRGSIAIFRG